MTAGPVVGNCRLCPAVGVPLMDSHIIPKWAYRRARDVTSTIGSPDPIRFQDGVALQTSEQIREHMLCGDCEQRICRDEDYVSRLAFQKDQTLGLAQFVRPEAIFSKGLRPLAGFKTRAASIAHLDCAALARFSASVFWRAHVSRSHRIDQLRLWNPQAEALRRFVLGKGPLPDRMCLTMIVPVEGEALTGIFSGVLFTPATGKKGNDGVHQFMVAGLVFNLTTGTLSQPSLCLACGNAPHVIIQHWKSIRILINAAEMIKTAEAKGRGARAARDRIA